MGHRAPELMRAHMPDASGRGAAVEQLPKIHRVRGARGLDHSAAHAHGRCQRAGSSVGEAVLGAVCSDSDVCLRSWRRPRQDSNLRPSD
jgi:hypothetical protein